MLPKTGCPFGISGKILLKKGATNFAIILIAPPFSPIRIIPIQSVKTPINPRHVSAALPASSKVLWTKIENISIP